MSAVRRKLNSQAGVAMVIALVFFLLCVMVGVVIVTAATVSAGSVALERQTWRETEALTSAAQLLADDIKGMTFTGAYTKTETVTTTVSENGKDSDGNQKYKTTVQETTSNAFYLANTTLTGSDLLGSAWLNELYQQKQDLVDPNPADVIANLTFAVSAAASGGEDDEADEDSTTNIPNVDCTLTVATDYTITAVLTCGDDDSKSTLTMVFEPQVSESVGDAVQSTDTSGSADTVSKAVKTTTTPYTTTIQWGDPVVTKGATS